MPKTTYDPVKDCGTLINCPIIYTLSLIGQKWKVPILWHISQEGPLRYNELFKRMHGVSGTMLSASLKELCDYGLLEKTVKDGSVIETFYSFTEDGADLVPILESLFDWGNNKMRNDGIVSDWSR